MGNESYQLYADDTVVYCPSKSIDLAENNLQELLTKFSKSCIENTLTINTKKSKIMNFGTRNKINKIDKIKGTNIHVGDENERLQIVPTYKYLGFNLDQRLNFKHYLDLLINTISFKIYLFSKVRRFLNERSAIIVYKTMILPFYDYCDIIYMFSNNLELKKMDRQHLRGMRICLDNGFNMEEIKLFANCKISNLGNRRKVHVRNFMLNKKHLCDENVNNINTRLHNGPIFKTCHPN